jgi:hypothetical protein
MEIPSEIKMQSELIDKVAGAIVAAQGELSNPPKTKTVYAGQKKYSFAPLPEILDAVRPVLKKHGLAVIQLVQDRTLSTRIVHTTGQWIGSMYPLPPVPDSQAMGSAITYARRYSLCAILGIAGEDDEDGEAATEAERMEQEARRKEAEKNLDGLKGKGKVQSAYDGKVLAPGEATLPAQRAGGVATTDNGRQTADRGEGAQESGDRSQRTEGKTAGLAAHALPGEKPAAETAATKGEKGAGRVAARSAPPTLNNGKAGRGEEGNGRQGAAGHTEPGEETRGGLAHSTGSGLAHSTGSTGSPQAGSGLAGIAKGLAALMRRDGITAEALKTYYVGKGHFPDPVEPSSLPSDYVAKLIKEENWEKAVAAIKGMG